MLAASTNLPPVAVAAIAFLVTVAALVNWWSRWRHDDRTEVWSKPLVTVLVVVLALAVGGDAVPVALMVAALVVCLVGDVALLPAIDRFVVGLAAFLVGHVLVMASAVAIGLDEPALAALAVVLVAPAAVLVGRRVVAGARAADAALAGPVVAYLVVISAMVVVSWSTGVVLAMVGAVAFIVSDSVLGWRAFVQEKRWMAVTVMATYHVALVCLALTPWAAA